MQETKESTVVMSRLKTLVALSVLDLKLDGNVASEHVTVIAVRTCKLLGCGR